MTQAVLSPVTLKGLEYEQACPVREHLWLYQIDIWFHDAAGLMVGFMSGPSANKVLHLDARGILKPFQILVR